MDICPVCEEVIPYDNDDFYEVAVNGEFRLAHADCYHSHTLADWEEDQVAGATMTITKSGGTLTLTPSAFTLDLTHSPVPHIALFQLANQMENQTGYWLDFREQPNGLVTEWMLMDKRGVAHQATGTPRRVTIPLA